MNHIDELLRREVFDLLMTAVKSSGGQIPDGTSKEQISQFETASGIVLPNELRDWFLTCNGPNVGYGYLFGINTEHDFLDVQNRLSIFPDWTGRGWVPLAGDGCGNYYVVATRKEYGPTNSVFFIDTINGHDTPTYLVASETWHCLRFLLKDFLEQTNWPFDRDEVVTADPEILKCSGIPLPWET